MPIALSSLLEVCFDTVIIGEPLAASDVSSGGGTAMIGSGFDLALSAIRGVVAKSMGLMTEVSLFPDRTLLHYLLGNNGRPDCIHCTDRAEPLGASYLLCFREFEGPSST